MIVIVPVRLNNTLFKCFSVVTLFDELCSKSLDFIITTDIKGLIHIQFQVYWNSWPQIYPVAALDSPSQSILFKCHYS